LLCKDTITAPKQTECPHSTTRLHDDFEAAANKYNAQLVSICLLNKNCHICAVTHKNIKTKQNLLPPYGKKYQTLELTRLQAEAVQ
jgi:hypothetical protein